MIGVLDFTDLSLIAKSVSIFCALEPEIDEKKMQTLLTRLIIKCKKRGRHCLSNLYHWVVVHCHVPLVEFLAKGLAQSAEQDNPHAATSIRKTRPRCSRGDET